MFDLLKCETTPIEIHDDGMRFTNAGKIVTKNCGSYDYVQYENPMLVATHIAIRKEREMIKARNIAKFS
jgi:hypothetical protein